ncbi:MAG: PAS domain S-box protein [Methylomonas sp.]|nr:PAS domain S-box protein [Methylomonas sp.]
MIEVEDVCVEVLIVSDDPCIFGPMLDSMKAHGMAIGFSRNGHSALQQLGADKPDVILLNLRLPDTDGIALCKQLQACVDTRSIPVVLMLDKAEIDSRIAGLQAGAVDYLIKPLVLDEVLTKLRLHIRRPLPMLQTTVEKKTEPKIPGNRENLCFSPGCEVCSELPVQQRYFREIFYNASIPMFLMEVAAVGGFKFLEVNRAYQTMMGMSAGQLRGKHLAGVHTGFDQAVAGQFDRMLSLCLQAGAVTESEDVMALPAGSISLHSSLIPMFDAHGRISHILGSSREMTELKRAEQQIHSMNYMLDQLHEAVYVIDSQFQIRYANNSACDALGYDRTELLGMRVHDLEPYLDAEKSLEAEEVTKAQRHRSFQSYHRAKDGTIFPVEISASPLLYQDQAMSLSVVRNVSERMQIDEERRRHLHFFESMDRVNRAIQGAIDLEIMLGDVLDEVLALFDSDRAYLVYPCNPEAASWHIPMARAKEGRPAVPRDNVNTVMDANCEQLFRLMLSADGPMTFGAGNSHHLHKSIADRFDAQSFMGMAIYPKADHAWQFCIDQCSYSRVWTPGEFKLFQEVGRRLADGLSNLLAYRALQASESEYRTLVEHVPLSIARYDAQGRISYLNSQLEKILQITTQEARGKRPTECFSEPYYVGYEKKLLQVAETGEMVKVEWEGTGDDGTEVGVITIVAEDDEEGNISGLLAIGQSFSLQRRIEEALKRSEALYGSVVSAMIEGVIVQSQDGKILSLNPAAEKMLRISSHNPGAYSFESSGVELMIDGKPLQEERHPAMRSLQSGLPQFGVEMSLRRIDGDEAWFLVNSHPLFAEGEAKPYAVVSTYHDISDKKRAESERSKAFAILKENEALLRERLKLERRFSKMADHVPGFLCTLKVGVDGQLSVIYISSGVKDIYGLAVDEIMEDVSVLHQRVHPDDKSGLEAAINQAVSHSTAFQHEYRISHPAQGVLWLEAKAMPSEQPDGGIMFHGFVQDITERKRMERTLQFIARSGWQESSETFLVSLARYLGQMLEVEYVLIDKLDVEPDFAETAVIYYNGEILPAMRYPLFGTPCENIVSSGLCCYPEHVRQLFPEDRLLSDMRVESYVGMPLLDSAANVIGLIAVMDGKPMVDCDRIASVLQLVAIRAAAELERDRFERVLEESRLFLHKVIDTLAEPVFVKDRRHRWILLNAAFCKIIGHPLEALLGKSDYDFFPKEEADDFWARDEEVFCTGHEHVCEENFTDRYGVTHNIITKKTRYIDDNGSAVLVGIVLDITERKQMEAMIRKREEEFRTLAENLPDVIVRYDKSLRQVYINKGHGKTLQPSGHGLLEKIPAALWRIAPSEAEAFGGKLQRVLDTGNPESTLIQTETTTGKMIYWTVNLVPEFGQNGDVSGVLSCATDVTTLKEYQRELEASRAQIRALASRNDKLREEERKHIARELHDDLGQRLTALKLDLSRLILRFGQGNKAMQQQVAEMEADIGITINLVRDVVSSLRPAALEMGIVSALEWLVQEFRKRSAVRFRLRCPERKLALDDNLATALFRIVQESLTNIIRHAMASEVEIVLSSDEGHYILTISDDGIGMDVDPRQKPASFGVIGIEERTLNLGGEISIKTALNQGVKLTVRIPVAPRDGEKS